MQFGIRGLTFTASSTRIGLRQWTAPPFRSAMTPSDRLLVLLLCTFVLASTAARAQSSEERWEGGEIYVLTSEMPGLGDLSGKVSHIVP